MSNEKSPASTSINCLTCIYTVQRLSPYKMGAFKN